MLTETTKMNSKKRFQQIPARVSALAESHQLGTPFKAYTQRWNSVIMYILIGLIPVLILLLAWYVHTSLDELAYLRSVNVVFNGNIDHELRARISLDQFYITQKLPISVVAYALSIVVCASMSFMFYIRQKQRLYIYSKGLLVSPGVREKEYRVMHWDEVKEIGADNCFRLANESEFVLMLPFFTPSMRKEIYETITSYVERYAIRIGDDGDSIDAASDR
ncbi:MAG: hypothetical protein H0W02_07485 [Ktedonobacteraceae bacterium]|nr:hypothetical protein [Ktedonobacteraceae bacterium]